MGVVGVVTNLLPFEYQWKTDSWQFWKTYGVTSNGSGWRQDDINQCLRVWVVVWVLPFAQHSAISVLRWEDSLCREPLHAWWTDYDNGQVVSRATDSFQRYTRNWVWLQVHWLVCLKYEYNNKTPTHRQIGMDVVLVGLYPTCSSQRRKYIKIWNRMTASILKQHPNTKRFKQMLIYFDIFILHIVSSQNTCLFEPFCVWIL